MKQGRATYDRVTGTKQEPHSRAVSPGGVDQLGQKVGNPGAVKELYEGRGLEAPMQSQVTHKSGSQGRH